MITCKQASRLISENQERSLTFSQRWSLRIHLWTCGNCRRFQRQMRFLRKLFHFLSNNLEILLQGPNLSSRSKERIRRALRKRNQL